MADNVGEGGQLDLDRYFVVERGELSEALDDFMQRGGALEYRRGLVGGAFLGAIMAAAFWLIGYGGRGVGGVLFTCVVTPILCALLWRTWRSEVFKLGGWHVADFAATMMEQGRKEAQSGRADG